jgi:hypothetical protein
MNDVSRKRYSARCASAMSEATDGIGLPIVTLRGGKSCLKGRYVYLNRMAIKDTCVQFSAQFEMGGTQEQDEL